MNEDEVQRMMAAAEERHAAAMHQQMQQMQQLMQQQAQAMQQQVLQLQRQAQSVAEARAPDVPAQEVRQQGARKSLVEKPEKFAGKTDKGGGFREWKLKVLAWIGLARPDLRKLMTTAEVEEQEISEETLSNWEYNLENVQEGNAELHAVLISLTSSDAFQVVLTCEEGAGCEVWRKLCKSYDAKNANDNVKRLVDILNASECDESELK